MDCIDVTYLAQCPPCTVNVMLTCALDGLYHFHELVGEINHARD